MQASGETALYDAVKTAVEMTDAAQGDERAIRAVVVLTDGQANRGTTVLHDIIRMESRKEKSHRLVPGLGRAKTRRSRSVARSSTRPR